MQMAIYLSTLANHLKSLVIIPKIVKYGNLHYLRLEYGHHAVEELLDVDWKRFSLGNAADRMVIAGRVKAMMLELITKIEKGDIPDDSPRTVEII